MTTTIETPHKKESLVPNVKMRTCLLNLIAYIPDQVQFPRVMEIVHSLGMKFPARLILIILEEGKGEISIETSPSPCEKRQNTYEQILIHAPKHLIEKVPFLVMPYLIPDLPVYLLWGQDPTTDDKVLPYFQGFATRIIFDASQTTDWGAYGQRMMDRVSHSSSDMMDLSWALISSWRDVLARLFNDTESLDNLKYCKKIRILHRDPSDTASGIYLLSWLAAQLGWKLNTTKVCEGVVETVFTHQHGTVATTIASDLSSKDSDRGISSIEIITSKDIVYKIAHRPCSGTVITHIIHDNFCEIPITLPFACLNKSFSFMKVLLHQQPGKHYSNMLSSLVQFSNGKQNHN